MNESRIRELREHFEHEHPVCEALDEVERLRAALQKISDVESHDRNWEPNYLQALADEALGGK